MRKNNHKIVKPRGVPIDQLPPEMKERIGIREPAVVPLRIVVLGRILSDLSGLPKKEALWALRKAIKELGGK